MNEIIALVPEFNPSSVKSLDSHQFVKRVETLKNAYNWDDRKVIFAVQQKMQGAARYWVDATDEIFQTWPEFVSKFLYDFPCISNAADVHLKMLKTKRETTESPQDYFYKMLAIGKKAFKINVSPTVIRRSQVNP
ncbi:uncharacterized protein LOC124461037 [Drosophila willistoni]|uniref:uncharacterized protein LOC124461037 n=1 Tax=Drosophila willistoni TaxID=7260 RepID=UPI001F077B14|nr:uncharacterized protein LOC124461037 [Drosophila willistoni]